MFTGKQGLSRMPASEPDHSTTGPRCTGAQARDSQALSDDPSTERMLFVFELLFVVIIKYSKD